MPNCDAGLDEANSHLVESVSRLTCQDVLFETENAFFTDEWEIGPKNLPKYSSSVVCGAF